VFVGLRLKLLRCLFSFRHTYLTVVWEFWSTSHALKTPKGKEEVLRELLWCARVESCPQQRRLLNRRIWRYRRAKRRTRAKEELRIAATRGCMPRSRRMSTVINWRKLFADTDPLQGLHQHFHNIYCLDTTAFERERLCKQHFIGTWRSLRIDILPFQITVATLAKAISKLKLGKSSPDGCTAEMYRL